MMCEQYINILKTVGGMKYFAPISTGESHSPQWIRRNGGLFALTRSLYKKRKEAKRI
jgi:hypothetical protein